MQQQLQPVKELLDNYHKKNSVYPSQNELLATLIAGGVDFQALRDPWDVPYRFVYSTEPRESVLTIYSNGPDKLPNTADDIQTLKFAWPYFHLNLGKATTDYFERTGNYIRDYPTLRDEMKRQSVDLDTLKDPWGRPYHFDFTIAGASYGIIAGAVDRTGCSPETTTATTFWNRLRS